jgi:hypothetical protein
MRASTPAKKELMLVAIGFGRADCSDLTSCSLISGFSSKQLQTS